MKDIKMVKSVNEEKESTKKKKLWRQEFFLKLRRSLHLIGTNSYKEKRAVILFKSSSLFNRKWYLSQYPKVKNIDLEPEEHYYKTGWKLGYNPSEEFDGNAYLMEYNDVKTLGKNPLEHYLLSGQYEGRHYASVNGDKMISPIQNLPFCLKPKTKLCDKIKYFFTYPIRVREEYEQLKAEIRQLEQMNH